MYLIDASYFQKEISIPNVNETYSESSDNLDYFIDEKVRLLLQKDILGLSLFSELDSHIENGVLEQDAPQKWIDFVNGVEYIDSNGNSKKWNGLLFELGSVNKSLLAYYVFNFWLQYNDTVVTGAGEQAISVTNSNRINSNRRIVDSWDAFLHMYQGNYENNGVFKGYVSGVWFEDYYHNSNNNNYVSCVGFLQDKKEDYPDAVCKLFRPMNYFNL